MKDHIRRAREAHKRRMALLATIGPEAAPDRILTVFREVYGLQYQNALTYAVMIREENGENVGNYQTALDQLRGEAA
jgi:hypothetical protein